MNTTSIGRLLATFCLQGLVSLEDLDQPGPNWLRIEGDRQKAFGRAQRLKQSCAFPPPLPHRNLARDWIAANRPEWEAMLIKTLNDEASPPPTNPLHGL